MAVSRNRCGQSLQHMASLRCPRLGSHGWHVAGGSPPPRGDGRSLWADGLGEALAWLAASSAENRGKERKQERKKKADSTLRCSQAVPHPSTNQALCHLTSEVRRDPVHSTRYGRQQMQCSQCCLQCGSMFSVATLRPGPISRVRPQSRPGNLGGGVLSGLRLASLRRG